MTRLHTWKGWYFAGTKLLTAALADARSQAAADHPDTPPDAMMTPMVRTVPQGIRVLVIGRPA